jgi:hypothetical protein
MMCITGNSVRKISFGGTFSFSNCHIIGLGNGSLVLIVFVHNNVQSNPDGFAYFAQQLKSGFWNMAGEAEAEYDPAILICIRHRIGC